MDTTTFQTDAPDALLSEYERLEPVLSALKSAAEAIQARLHDVASALDAITRPSVAPRSVAAPLLRVGFRYREEIVSTHVYKDIFAGVLLRLWKEFPEKRDAVAAAMAALGRSRRYVSPDRNRLFPYSSPEWARRHSAPLIDGWWVDLNLNLERYRLLLPRAVRAAGLQWKSDVDVCWRTVRPSLPVAARPTPMVDEAKRPEQLQASL
jgi:hypothetical protein